MSYMFLCELEKLVEAKKTKTEILKIFDINFSQFK